MQTYIALLRGINVGGHNKIKMADLHILFENEGFKNTTTYIQSGNVNFQSKLTSISKIEEIIKRAVSDTFNYNINVLVKTKNELISVFENNPFIKNNKVDLSKLHVTFLKKQPNIEQINNLESVSLTNYDEFKIINKIMYVHCPISYAKTKLNNNVVEKKLATSCTSRNWRTITKLIELTNIE